MRKYLKEIYNQTIALPPAPAPHLHGSTPRRLSVGAEPPRRCHCAAPSHGRRDIRAPRWSREGEEEGKGNRKEKGKRKEGGGRRRVVSNVSSVNYVKCKIIIDVLKNKIIIGNRE